MTEETTETINTGDTENKPSDLHELFSLLEEPEMAETDESPTTDGEAPEKVKQAKPQSLKALAEKLALEDKDLYAIEVPMANGETRTLGQLKDIASTQEQFTVRELELEERHTKREQELLRAQNELRELIAALPTNALKPEAIEKAARQYEATTQRERQATLEVIPEWKDEAKRTEELTEIVNHLEGYGFPKSFITQVNDHRLLKYIRDSWKREVRVNKALEQMRSKVPTSKASKPTDKALKRPGSQVRPSGSSQKQSIQQLFLEQ